MQKCHILMSDNQNLSSVIEIWKNQDGVEQLNYSSSLSQDCELLIYVQGHPKFMEQHFLWLMPVVCRMNIHLHHSLGLFHPFEKQNSSVFWNLCWYKQYKSPFCFAYCRVISNCTWSPSELKRVKLPDWWFYIPSYQILSDHLIVGM